MDKELLKQLHDYVYSTPANSPEREARLNELSDADQEELYDFAVGLLSGRIKRSESEEKIMDTTNMSYEEWKRLDKQVQTRQKGAGTRMMNFEIAHPAIAQRYMQKSLDDAQKRAEIMSIKDQHERWAAIQRNIGIF